ncbi:uncharacterized protein LOC115620283 [Scaptodrosophila lebanonensis]|uniref:Uncharacterized protein LOC115620283 n=1 Tax=Drosophila lebanonensis TaxID=7225 RepID=A0A6J2T362_DROLE|nr:uncharacterized protein LOC115620283 [Scaptodrosophila lebanonensis]
MHISYLANMSMLLALTGLGISEWVEIAKSRPKDSPSTYSRTQVQRFAEEISKMDDNTTPSPVWIEYQRERFGMASSNPLLEVKSSAPPKVEVVVTPRVETTSRRHSAQSEDYEEAEAIVETEETEALPASVEQDSDLEAEIQLPTMQGFLKFLKSMQNSWIKKSALSIEKKIKLLKQLRDNLLKAIEDQFSVLWQPTDRKHRRRRGLLDESNLDFPPEAAIMTINCLTFAVFLIKLVLQVVHIIKSKHYNFSGFNVNSEMVRTP